MLLLGHRGARRYAPENSIAAFELALAHGCDGFEFDVRVSSDGRAVVCHDSRLAGLTVAGSTYEDLAGRDPCLMTLDEVLAHFAARAYLYIELKVLGVEEQLTSALAANIPSRGYVVASFLPEAIESVYARDARIPLGLICSNWDEFLQWRYLPVRIVMPQHRLITSELIRELHAEDKQVFAWTVNQKTQMRSLAELEVDGILSDDTALLGRTFGRSGQVPVS